MNTFLTVTWYGSITVVALYALLNVGVALLLRRRRPQPDRSQPLSILIAARNEERAILDTLRSLDALDYPRAKLDILIGDDQSTDATAQLVQDFIRDKPHFRYHYCDQQFPGIRAKQNVLAQLTPLVRHPIVLHTDADIQVQPDWAALHAGLYRDPRIGVASGITTVFDASVFARLQALDWLQALSTVACMNQLGVQITALGNNLSMRQTAYAATPGYAKLPFCITEDLLIMRAITARGYRMEWIWHPDTLNRTRAPESLRTYLNQRKRWYKGGMQYSPWYAHILFGIHASCYPTLVIALVTGSIGWSLFGTLMGAKVAADYALLIRACRDMRRSSLIPYLPLFTLYNFALVFVMLLLFPFPSRYSWKGRRFR